MCSHLFSNRSLLECLFIRKIYSNRDADMYYIQSMISYILYCGSLTFNSADLTVSLSKIHNSICGKDGIPCLLMHNHDVYIRFSQIIFKDNTLKDFIIHKAVVSRDEGK